MQIKNTARPAILMSVTMQGRFWTNICILVWIYFKKTCVFQWPSLRKQPKTNVQRLQRFFFFFLGGGGREGRGIRDKVGINLLLSPLVWVLKNSRYIWKPNMHILNFYWKNSIAHHFPHTLWFTITTWIFGEWLAKLSYFQEIGESAYWYK